MAKQSGAEAASRPSHYPHLDECCVDDARGHTVDLHTPVGPLCRKALRQLHNCRAGRQACGHAGGQEHTAFSSKQMHANLHEPKMQPLPPGGCCSCPRNPSTAAHLPPWTRCMLPASAGVAPAVRPCWQCL